MVDMRDFVRTVSHGGIAAHGEGPAKEGLCHRQHHHQAENRVGWCFEEAAQHVSFTYYSPAVLEGTAEGGREEQCREYAPVEGGKG